MDDELRRRICEAALAIGAAVRYQRAGTVEFLVDLDSSKFYVIEVNPRIQLEHTVTEMVTYPENVVREFVKASAPMGSTSSASSTRYAATATGASRRCSGNGRSHARTYSQCCLAASDSQIPLEV